MSESPRITGTIGVSWLLPISSPASQASRANRIARSFSRAARCGSNLAMRTAASAAAALAGEQAVAKTKDGVVYLRYSINGARPAMYPPPLPSALLIVPIQRSPSTGSMPKCSQIPRPLGPITPIEWASST